MSVTDELRVLQVRIGAMPDGNFGAKSRATLFAALSNRRAPALTEGDLERVAAELGVAPAVIRAVRKVEAPRGPFDDQGRPSILYEKHVFSRNTGRMFDRHYPALSAPAWEPGTYGPYSGQYDKLADAIALAPEAAFKACSWGAFQVLGENARDLGYGTAINMAFTLRESEAAHLDSFARYVRVKGLVDELRQCEPGNSESCIPFVSRYNGSGYRKNRYHIKLAEAMR